MKVTFKPLSLAVAVSAAAAGYAGTVNAQTLADNTGLGDLGIVPYYTTQSSYSTGVSVINTSNLTQVVKIRLRRGPDSMDALDFNVVMSPEDAWTGYIQLAGDDSGDIRFYTNDESCTVPALQSGPEGRYFTMPDIYREGAEEGYIEVLGMGSANANQPISIAALHKSDGIPLNCDLVRENFLRGLTPSNYGLTKASVAPRLQGVVNSALTMQGPAGSLSTYGDTGNALKVSYFIKSDETGTEFGNDAVHIANFMDGPSITNQRQGINEGDLQGFDHPNLNGGAPTSASGAGYLNIPGAAQQGAYEPLRVALGAVSVINDWSKNVVSDGTNNFSVDTDWVVTTPGQYLMTQLALYIDSLEPGGSPCGVVDNLSATDRDFGDYVDDEDADDYGANCDFRDIPLTVSASVWDREEQVIEADPDDLVVSPAPVVPPTIVSFDREVNVISWGDKLVLGSAKNVVIPVPEGAQAGWASVSVTPNEETVQMICTPDGSLGEVPVPYYCEETTTNPPLVGFVAWQRNFGDNPAANYGRIIEHSFVSGGQP